MVRSNVNNSVGVTDFMQIPEKKERKIREIAVRMNLKKKWKFYFPRFVMLFRYPPQLLRKPQTNQRKLQFGQTVPL